MENHPPRPGRRAQHVFADRGGWISGPSIGATEDVPAAQVRGGDVLVRDGQVLTVLADPASAWYHEDGQIVAGLSIACSYPGGRWVLYRRGSELLARVVTS